VSANVHKYPVAANQSRKCFCGIGVVQSPIAPKMFSRSRNAELSDRVYTGRKRKKGAVRNRGGRQRCYMPDTV